MKYQQCQQHLLVLFIFSLNVWGNVLDAGWIIQEVDLTGSYCAPTCLQIDSYGNPHIVYLNDKGENKYAKLIGNSWYTVYIDTTNIWNSSSSLSLDSKNNAHIAYSDINPPLSRATFNLKYTYGDGTSWHNQMVDSITRTSAFSSIAIDSNGFPHIAYGEVKLMYAQWTGLSWNTVIVDSTTGGSGQYCSLVLDNNNFAHIAYHNEGSRCLKYASWDGSSWQIQMIDLKSKWIVGLDTSITLDKNEYPYISYFASTYNHDKKCTESKIKLAKWTGREWTRQTVDKEAFNFSTSIAFDPQGTLHISYIGFSNYSSKNCLKHAKWTDSYWQNEVVDLDGYSSPSMIIDSSGTIHISYIGMGSLKYAKKLE